MRIVIDTEKGRIVLPRSFFAQLDKMNKILAEGGSTKKWTAEEYVKEQKDKRPEQLLTTTLLLVLVAAIAVFAAAILRYVFFVAGVLK